MRSVIGVLVIGLLGFVSTGYSSKVKKPEFKSGSAYFFSHGEHIRAAMEKLPPRGSQQTKVEAEIRSSQIENISYALDVTLTDNGFAGTTTVHFDVQKGADFSKQGLFLELAAAKMNLVLFNGNVLDKKVYEKDRIQLPTSQLNLKEQNELVITYSANYRDDGFGVHRSKVGNHTYIYTQFEAYEANRLFPCFDQPDLKATLQLNVTAPAAWEVISTTREKSAVSGKVKETRDWVFPETQKISTYGFSLHAGDYEKWAPKKPDGTDDYYRVPMRLFARKEFSEVIDPDFWFKSQRLAIDFFEKEFKVPYPFKKLDSLIVPKFAFGAMENIGAVTYSEGLFAGVINPKVTLASVMAHEIAHMWTGNYVTLQWWDDFWLNESFAEFLAFWAVADYGDQLGLPTGWKGFVSGRQRGAYAQDSGKLEIVEPDGKISGRRPHPVMAKLDSTENIMSVVDGMSYMKGGTILRMLMHKVGREKFVLTLQNYVNTFQWGNVNREEFVGVFGQTLSTSNPFADWAKAWFGTVGFNSLEAEFECKDGKVSKFILKQGTAVGDDVLRPHVTQVALYYPQKTHRPTVAAGLVVDVHYSVKETSVDSLLTVECPVMVHPNFEFVDYTKVIFDPKTRAYAKGKLDQISDLHLRRMIGTQIKEADALAEKQLK